MLQLKEKSWICFFAAILSLCFASLANSESGISNRTVILQNNLAYWKILDRLEGRTSLEQKWHKGLKKTVIKFNGTIGLVGPNGVSSQVATIDRFNRVPASVSWKMRVTRGTKVKFLLDTTLGERELSYMAFAGNKKKITEKGIRHSLGTVTVGKWVEVKRNLSADLQSTEPKNKIRSIKYLQIKGRGSVADVNIRYLPLQLPEKESVPVESKPDIQFAKNESNENAGIPSLAPQPVIAAAIGGARRTLNFNPTQIEPRLDLNIDGQLDEEQWKSAKVANDFRATEKRIRPADSTEVLVLSDKSHLYFAFRCFDSQPDLINAIKTLRDGGLGIDDSVSVQIDAYKNFETAATYSLSSIGTKNDELSGGSAKKIQWKGDWKGAAVRTDYGWAAEIAIPFDILNFSADATDFGINFSRYQHRTAERSHWVKPSSDKNREPHGLLAGIVLPQAKSGRVWTFMPYVVAGKNVYDRKGVLQENEVHGGVTVKYEPRNNFTGLVEIYPDFSQVESQISDIDFSYNEKETADPRTFFQEGAAYFGSDSEYFYSPKIPDFDAGIKTFMQNGKSVFGALAVTAPDGRNDIHARYRHKLEGNSGVTVTAVASDQQESQNQLLAGGFDKSFRSGLFYDITGAMTRNTLVDEDDSSGKSGKLILGLKRDQWELGLNSDYYEAEYQPGAALLNSDLPGTLSNGLYASVYKEGEGNIKQINGNVTLSRRDTLDGERQNEGLYLSTDFELLGNSRIQLSYSQYDYKPVSDVPGVFSTDVNNDHYWSANLDFNIYSAKFGYGLFAADGKLGGGEYRYLSGYAWFNPTNTTNLKVSTEDLQSFGRYRQTTFSGGWDISENNGVIARFSRGENYEHTRLAYRRKVSSGMDVFVAVQQQSDNDSEVTSKFVWTF